jgi:hypothetical protein
LLYGQPGICPGIINSLSKQVCCSLVIGKGEDWRDKTHFRTAYGLAWADWIILMPLLVSGSIGVLLCQAWGYALRGAAGAISLFLH